MKVSKFGIVKPKELPSYQYFVKLKIFSSIFIITFLCFAFWLLFYSQISETIKVGIYCLLVFLIPLAWSIVFTRFDEIPKKFENETIDINKEDLDENIHRKRRVPSFRRFIVIKILSLLYIVFSVMFIYWAYPNLNFPMAMKLPILALPVSFIPWAISFIIRSYQKYLVYSEKYDF